MTKVTLLASVSEHAAGQTIELDTETADRWILLGYAEGDLSRAYDHVEVETIEAFHQVVQV
jgi:hypothetical protein